MACRESLSATHLVVTHLRFEHLATEALRDSVAAIAELVGASDDARASQAARYS